MIQASPVYTFDSLHHIYAIDGVQVPSITQLLEKGGLVDGSAYFTAESRRRGQEVHALCMDYELGALDLPRLESPYRGYVLGYVAAVQALKPTWDQIEVFDVHPALKFGGRPDRVGGCLARPTVGEIKSAAKAKHHPIQTALQALLVAPRLRLKPEAIQRLVIYVKASGKFSIEVHEQRKDFDVALSLVKGFCTWNG